MKSAEIRKTFLDFFKEKGHKIVPSAPIVAKDDPTLMFTNAGMNQFKDFFLGTANPSSLRIADTQKCLRVSGKHNDLEEVGKDSYHHTMFEMLGNWSFGDYFKKEAIDWAWELLVGHFGLDKERLYATVFGGDRKDGLVEDSESRQFWKAHLPEERILNCGKKDNFWEMGDTGPCGPCSEIHIDLRSDEQREKLDGAELVNKDHPLVIEVWNLVFIEFNRMADGSLKNLPAKHVDTGMGFERLTMALQGKRSNYDTDIFMPFIQKIANDTGIKYKGTYEAEPNTDMAMRVITDHLRAVCFTIADGQMPSNTGAGYVVRRILRRAIRYYYTFLNIDSPYLCGLVPMLADQFADVFPELKAQEDFVRNVVEEEERSFLRTLSDGLKRLQQLEIKGGVLDGALAFELYDTYGFPLDLTRLILEEQGIKLDETGFYKELEAQKERSRSDAKMELGDWIEIIPLDSVEFVGYDNYEYDAKVTRYREVGVKGKTEYHLVLDKTPFYPEGGGQIGDTGKLTLGDQEVIRVLDTRKENDLIIHIVDKLPSDPTAMVHASVDVKRRQSTVRNHSATHLLHAALRKVLGDHVQQKGSLVSHDHLRFDFSHFQKVDDEELREIERLVNQKIREDIERGEDRKIPIIEAKEAGAMMLFGEKYGETVRMITFDPGYSIELCGGCHVERTGEIGLFKITSESSVAAGVRRIEATTGEMALAYVDEKLATLDQIAHQLKSPDPVKAVDMLQNEVRDLKRKVESLQSARAGNLKDELLSEVEEWDGIQMIGKVVHVEDSKTLKNLVFELEKSLTDGVIILGADLGGKPQLMMAVSKPLTESKPIHAGKIIKEAAAEVRGGGGGQPFFASAGGSDPSGLEKALEKAALLVKEAL